MVSIASYDCTTACVFIHLLVDIQVMFSLRPLYIKLLWTFYLCLYVDKELIRGMWPVNILARNGWDFCSVYVKLNGVDKLSSKVVGPFYIPTSHGEVPFASHPIRCYYQILKISRYSWYTVIFKLRLSDE